MKKPSLRPAIPGDYEAIYGQPLDFTIRAYTAEIDGRVVGIGGVGYHQNQTILFSKMTDELKPYKRFIVECARLAGEMAREIRAPAIADPDAPLSCKLLLRLGMTLIGNSPEGDMFAWPPQHCSSQHSSPRAERLCKPTRQERPQNSTQPRSA